MVAWPVYFAFTALLAFGVRVASTWNAKARLFISGRKDWKAQLRSLPAKTSTRVWFHVASLGEFEQARPVIEALAKRTQSDIMLTFFSPSGYEIRKNYPHATVLYLPLDLPGNANHWIATVQPDVAIFVKYDLWPGYLRALDKAGIPFLLIAAHIRPGAFFNSWSIPPVASLLKKSKMIFLQNQDHLEFVKQNGFTNVQVAGDTRVDRVASLPIESIDKLPPFLVEADPFDLVAGSTWPEDEKLLIDAIQQLDFRIILAPHDVSETNIERLIHSMPMRPARLSTLSHADHANPVLIIDTIGMLAWIYRCGRIAYVGGGFGNGIHNILEPMAHHKPVIFGPQYQSFPEAVDMVETAGGFSIENGKQLVSTLKTLSGSAGMRAGEIAGQYIQTHGGATEIIMTYLLESIPFASKS